MPKHEEIWAWIDGLVENGESATIGTAEDPLDILIRQEEDDIQDTGFNLNHLSVKATK